MGADKSDVDYTIGVIHPYDQSIFVSSKIENYTPIFEDASITEVSLHIHGTSQQIKYADTKLA